MRRGFAGIAGALLVALGLLVLVGWYWRIEALLQIRPTWVPMQYNTALGFLGLGVALLLSRGGRAGPARVVAGAVSVLGLLTLFQYASGVDLGIDELLMEASITVETSHPGRMAPNSALCFLLGGAAILLIGVGASAAVTAGAAVLAVITASLGAVALAGYAVGLPTAYGWGNLTRMAAHTSIGFLVGGVGIFLLTSSVWARRERARRVAFGAVAAVGATLALTVGLWQALVAAESLRAQEQADAVIRAVAGGITSDAEANALALERLALRWDLGRATREEWEADAERYVADTIFEQVAWLDGAGEVRWRVPASGDIASLWESARTIETVDGTLASRTAGRSSLASVRGAGWNGSIMLAPLQTEPPLDGYMLATVAHEDFLGTSLGVVRPFYDVEVHDAEGLVYRSGDSPVEGPVVASTPLVVLGENWTLRAAPVAPVSSPATALVLVFGGGLAVALGIALRQTSLARDRFDQLTDSLEVLEVRTEALQRANKELEQFAYAASHDLRSPIRGIENLATWIAEDTGLSDESRSHLELLQRRVDRAGALLDSLLAYARAGGSSGEPRSVDLAEMLDEVIDMLAPPASVAIRTPSRPATIRTDHTALRQVLFNLISNAVKHRDRDDLEVRVEVRSTEGGCEILVSDDGPGIPPEMRERIFEMFQTLKPRDEVEGSGMGLALVRKYVRGVGGKIAVEGREPRGVTFRVHWPCEVES